MNNENRFTISPCRFPALAQLAEIFRANHRFARDIVDRGAATFGESWAEDCETVLGALFSTSESLTLAAKGYSSFSMHSMRLQALFEKERVYRAKTYAEAASEVYFNERHMMDEYLPGLLLSHFFWPHHYRQIQFFDSAFVSSMKQSGASSFVEVGVGTGIYSSHILRKLGSVTGTGFDISPSSKHFAERHVSALGLADRYNVELRDVTKHLPESPADWLVCVEVLEHLEDPVEFLKALRAHLAPGGKAFITAALNAAHADHIYLYRTAGEVEEQLAEAGFNLEQSFVGAAYKPVAKSVPVPLAAAFVVF